MTPQMMVPFSVDETGLSDATHEHLISGDMTPDHLLDRATVSVMERFFVPVYLFHGRFEARWTASFGYDRQEPYTAYETRYEGNRTRRVAVTRYRTVTDWRPVSGSDNGKYAALAYAGHKLLSSRLGATALVEWNALIGRLIAFDRSRLIGLSAEPFETAEDDAYKERAKPRVNAIIDSSVKQHAQGDRQRDWHWKAQTDPAGTIAAYIPICHAVYEFENKSYDVWFSGVDSARQVHDPLPVDKGRQREIVLGFIPLAGAAIAAAVAIFQFEAEWPAPVGGVCTAALFGYIRRRSIIGHSKRVRQISLMQRKAAASAGTSGAGSARQMLLQGPQTPKPALANPALNKFILPVATLLLAVVAVKDALLPSDSHSKSSYATSQAAARVAPPRTTTASIAATKPKPSSQSAPIAPASVSAVGAGQIQEPQNLPLPGSSAVAASPVGDQAITEECARRDNNGETYHCSTNDNGLTFQSTSLTVYFGKSCDAESPLLGGGTWRIFPGKGFGAHFTSRNVWFPQQDPPTDFPNCHDALPTRASVADTKALGIPSFDCRSAAKPSESTICDDEALATQDSSLSALYRSALVNSPAPSAVRAEQADWLARRDSCASDRGCLSRAYAQRISALRARHGEAASQRPMPPTTQAHLASSAYAKSAREPGTSKERDETGVK